MSDLRDLYQELILDHNRRPRNFGPLAGANRSARGVNPLCGDKVAVHLHVEGDRVTEVSFEGTGCAISIASASVMTESLKARSCDDARAMFERFHQMVAADDGGGNNGAGMGKLAAFAGVRDYPARVKCATLAWHTLRAALDGDDKAVSTE
ncbi:MAG: SUF system NifU family Fe-S cluster assembly protein [Deltaproteobacteria bacterium]|nr:SUF system NifU family Fe-S cluster assembly protein [Deltaproteobacteria bacterium]